MALSRDLVVLQLQLEGNSLDKAHLIMPYSTSNRLQEVLKAAE